MPESSQADSAEPTRNTPVQAPPVVPSSAALADLAALVRGRFGFDLALYKPATVERRLQRRMSLRSTETLEEYVALLGSDPEELAALHRDMMLTVTGFFRDGDPFEALRTRVIPRLLEQHGPRDELRFWVPACATGQEAYSVAICMLEALEERGTKQAFQVFGTDAEEGSITTARRGLYGLSIEAEVSPKRLQRFFTRDDGGYQVAKRVRDHVIFSRHDLLQDAPFSRLDLITCRNVLIYLQIEAQESVLRRLHFALLPHGALMLGSAETVGDSNGLFTLLDRENKVYVKRPVSSAPWSIGPRPKGLEQRQPAALPRGSATLGGIVDRLLLETLAPPAVVIDERLEVVLFRGKTGPYIEPASGSPSFQLLKVTPVELHAELRRVASEALEKQLHANGTATVLRDGASIAVRLTAQPLLVPGVDAHFAVIAFEPAPPRDGSSAPADRVAELERELGDTRRYLRDTLEEHQVATEDLRATNEELQSTNEELQSTNEELVVSREELQAMNDELVSTNDALRSSVGDGAEVPPRTSQHVTDQPLLVLDGALRVHWASPSWYARFGLTRAAVEGTTLAALDGWSQPELLERLHHAANGGVPIAGLALTVAAASREPVHAAVHASRLPGPPGAVLLLVSFEVAG